MTGLCVSLGIICILYYLFLVIHAGFLVNFGWFWAAAGIVFLVTAFLRRDPDRTGAVWISRILLILIAAGCIAIGVMSASVIGGMQSREPENLQYAVVLGAQVKGKTPSRALVQRLDRAFEIAKDSPRLTLVLSGGKGEGEHISEAECMRDYLVRKGITEKRMVLEDRSMSTRENLVFSDELTGCAKKRCGIVTNDFHLYRALKIAKKAGYQDVSGVAAESEALMKPHFIVREAVALLYGMLTG